MELEKLSGLEIGNLVNRKEVKPTEVIEYFARRIEERNPSLNAFVYTKFDDAIQEAKILEQRIMNKEKVGVFAGVPIGLKDFLPSKRGWTNTHGGVKSLEAVDTEDSAFYSAMKSAGAIAIGKTNAPAFGFSGCTNNKLYGPTHNPFNLEYNSGGSSGGSAAAVADGLVPISECGDAGGSTRIPAAWCNLYGFKAGIGRIPNICRPDAWTATHPFCCGGGETKTVEDSLALYNLMNRFDPRDPFSVPFRFPDPGIKKLKVAVTLDFGIYDVCDEIKETIKQTAEDIKQNAGINCDVMYVDMKFKHTLDEFTDMWCTAISIDTALDIYNWKKDGFDLIGKHSDELPEDFIYFNERAANMTIYDYRRFNEVRTDVLDAFEDIFYNYDIILGPVTSCMPIKNKDLSTINTINFSTAFLVNFVGYPAASIPIGMSNGLPIGGQLIGRKYHEYDVFNISKRMSKYNMWSYNEALNRM